MAGQVFIVTRGAENIKLGAVEVLLIEKAQVTDFLQKREATVESRLALRRQELAEAEESAQKAKADYDLFTRSKPDPDLWSASRKGTILTNDFFSRDRACVALMSKIETLWRQSDALSGQLRPLWAQRKAIEKRLLDGAGSAWADMDREEALDKKIQPLQEQQSDLDSESNTLLRKLGDIVRLADTEKMGKLDTLSARAAIARARFDNSPTVEDFLAEFFPTPTQKTLTDADGRFSFSFPHHKSLTIFATAKRAVLDSTEKYYWLVNAPADPQMGQVFLSNNNLIFADPDGYFKLKPKELP